MTPLLVGIAIWVAIQLLIGLAVARRWAARDGASEDDFFVAGRRLSLVVGSFSVFATWFGAETCVGAAGQIHTDGLSSASVEPFAYGICLLGTGLLFAAPLWRRRVTTLADLLRQRFSSGVERFAALVLIPPSLFWAAAQIRAFGQILAAASGDGLGVETGILVAAGIAVSYTVLGGLLADVVTDVVQGLALIVGLACLTVAVVHELGGVAAVWDAIEFGARDGGGGGGGGGERAPAGLALVEAWAIPICGSIVAQEVVSRCLAARSAATARWTGIGGGGLYLAVGCLPVLLGLVGPALLPDLEDGEQLLPLLADRYLSQLGAIVFVGALVAAILSTVDSALLVASSFLSRNLVLSGARGARVSERGRLVVARLGVVGFGAAAWALAHGSDGGVYGLIADASAFGSAGVLVVVTAGLFSHVGGAVSAYLALGGGAMTWILLRYAVGDAYAYPFLTSLAAAAAGYVVGAASGRARTR